ncbi:unnamed protein product [Cutaneotrichosporon oleaginosum]
MRMPAAHPDLQRRHTHAQHISPPTFSPDPHADFAPSSKANARAVWRHGDLSRFNVAKINAWSASVHPSPRRPRDFDGPSLDIPSNAPHVDDSPPIWLQPPQWVDQSSLAYRHGLPVPFASILHWRNNVDLALRGHRLAPYHIIMRSSSQSLVAQYGSFPQSQQQSYDLHRNRQTPAERQSRPLKQPPRDRRRRRRARSLPDSNALPPLIGPLIRIGFPEDGPLVLGARGRKSRTTGKFFLVHPSTLLTQAMRARASVTPDSNRSADATHYTVAPKQRLPPFLRERAIQAARQ